jgi:hypothetical protein
LTSYLATLNRAYEFSRIQQAAKTARTASEDSAKAVAAIRSTIPKLEAEIKFGQEILLLWFALAASATRIWLPAKSKLVSLGHEWKIKRHNALVLQGVIMRVFARLYLKNAYVLRKIGPNMVLRAKIAKKRVAVRIICTFLMETKSVYAAVRNLKRFRSKFAAARNMVLQHLETKYLRVQWLLSFWNNIERSRLKASRCGACFINTTCMRSELNAGWSKSKQFRSTSSGCCSCSRLSLFKPSSAPLHQPGWRSTGCGLKIFPAKKWSLDFCRT